MTLVAFDRQLDQVPLDGVEGPDMSLIVKNPDRQIRLREIEGVRGRP